MPAFATTNDVAAAGSKCTATVTFAAPKLAAPTLLIYAEKGGTISDAEADEIVRALKQGRKQRIDGAGHMIPWDRLDAFVSAVHEFVAH